MSCVASPPLHVASAGDSHGSPMSCCSCFSWKLSSNANSSCSAGLSRLRASLMVTGIVSSSNSTHPKAAAKLRAAHARCCPLPAAKCGRVRRDVSKTSQLPRIEDFESDLENRFPHRTLVRVLVGWESSHTHTYIYLHISLQFSRARWVSTTPVDAERQGHSAVMPALQLPAIRAQPASPVPACALRAEYKLVRRGEGWQATIDA